MRFELRGALALALLLPACGDDDSGSGVAVDAAIDQQQAVWPDASEQAACAGLVLAPAPLQGTTPWGNLDLALDYVGAGDCLTITHAVFAWRGMNGAVMNIEFPYPVKVEQDGSRYVTAGTFDEDARVTWTAPNAAPVDTVAAVRIDVTTWHEGRPTHSIDVTFSMLDSRFTLAPMHITGTFCDWWYYLC